MTYRDLPSVDALLQRLPGYPHAVAVPVIRRVLAEARERIADSGEAGDVEAAARARLEALARPSLRRVINATGVVLHTNLGRAPLGAVAFHQGYSNLEYDLESGERGKRDTHTARLVEALFGAPGIVVNNNAAAVFLALHELASGYEAIVSRGELIEIGDGFRIPDIMARSGAVLREVGTTNRTSIEDYRAAINERTRVILRVHPSNFRISGFTAKPELKELASLARERGLPLYEDLGSGCLADLRDVGVDEPTVRASIDAGADLVSFSGDKLLGGPQAGVLAGRADLVARLRRNPMFRALRVDKLIIQALEAALRSTMFGDGPPALRMIRMTAGEIRARAERIAPLIRAEIVEGESVIGGGSTPEQRLPTALLSLPCSLEPRLRGGDPPIIGRVEKDRLLLDLRTVLPEEEPELLAAIAQA